MIASGPGVGVGVGVGQEREGKTEIGKIDVDLGVATAPTITMILGTEIRTDMATDSGGRTGTASGRNRNRTSCHWSLLLVR